MKQLAGLVLVATALTAVASFGLGDDGLFVPSMGAGIERSMRGAPDDDAVAAPVTAITVPAASPEAASTTPEIVSGTTTGTVTGVTWATACVTGPTACSTGAGTFSCSVTQTQDCAAAQTVTVVATGPGGTGNDTTDLLFPAFQLLPGSTTPNDLPDSLTVNSVAMTLIIACDAGGISGTDWVCRGPSGSITLSETGSGASPTTTTLTPFHALDSTERSVVFPTSGGGKYYAGASSLPDLADGDDLVVEVVRKPVCCNNMTYFAERNTLTAAGWSLHTITSGGALRLEVGDGTNNSATGSGSISSVERTHALAYWDASDTGTTGGQCGGIYINGAASGGTCSAAPSTVGTPSTAAVPTIDATADGNNRPSVANREITSLRAWKCNGCLPGGAANLTEMAPISRERTAHAFGAAPLLAAGIDSPTTLARASTAFIDVIDGVTRALYLVNNAVPRISRRGAGGVAVTGYLSEPQTTNLALQSQTLGTTWTAIDAGDNVLANAFAGADLTVTGDNVDGDDTGDSEHGLRQGIAVVAGTTYTFSGWPKGGEKTWTGLRDATGANEVASFDSTACAACNQLSGDCAAAVGTVGAGVTQARAVPYHVDTTGDGVADVELCRVSITFVADATGTDNFDLLCAEGDNDFSYTDTGAAADCGWWGIEVEAFPMMTSYQATTTASVTRSADDLRFDGASHYTGSPTTMDTVFLCPNYDVAAITGFAFAGSPTTDYVAHRITAADRPEGVGVVASAATWQIESAVDAANGAAHTQRTTATTNDIEVFYDGASIGTDVSAAVPAAGGTVRVTGGTASGASGACLLTNLRLWSRDVTPTEAP